MRSPDLPDPANGSHESYICLIRRYSYFFGPFITAFIFCLLTYITWGKWQDIIIDFGRELYIPWRLTQGNVLYRDLAYLNGPFSPYFNALLFSLFGVSYYTLILCNLVILILITYLIYIITLKIFNNFLATIASIVFLSVFGFGHIVGIGNYNFVTPYSHEMTHGLLLSFIIIYLFTRTLNNFCHIYIVLIGILLGLISLGKGEIFTAALLGVATGMVYTFLKHQFSLKDMIICIFFLTISFLVPVFMALGLLSSQMPLREALRGLLGTWAGLLTSKVSNNSFYLHCMGLDQPGWNLLRMVGQFAGVVLLTTALAIIDIFRQETSRFFWLIISAVLILFVIIIKKPLIPWFLTGPPLPLTSFSLFLMCLIICFRKRFDCTLCQRLAPLAILSIFSFGLLAKIFLNSRLFHYGFALAMPATLILVVGLVGLGSQVLVARYQRGDFFRILATIIIIADTIFYLKISFYYYNKKTFPINYNDEVIMTYNPAFDPRSEPIAELIFKLQSLPEIENFIVLPEGVMLNYLLRKPCPIKYINFMPPEMIIFGEHEIFDAIQKHPPQYIVLIPKDTREYGLPEFGEDISYGYKIMTWINQRYKIIWQREMRGNVPKKIMILKRAWIKY